MKKTFFAALALLLLTSCSEKTPHAGWTYDTVVYEMNLRRSDGLMVFDIVHIITKNLWKEVEEGMKRGGSL